MATVGDGRFQFGVDADAHHAPAFGRGEHFEALALRPGSLVFLDQPGADHVIDGRDEETRSECGGGERPWGDRSGRRACRHLTAIRSALSPPHDDKTPHDGFPSVRAGQLVGIRGAAAIDGFRLQIPQLARAGELIGRVGFSLMWPLRGRRYGFPTLSEPGFEVRAVPLVRSLR